MAGEIIICIKKYAFDTNMTHQLFIYLGMTLSLFEGPFAKHIIGCGNITLQSGPILQTRINLNPNMDK